jgi:nucleoside-diphosphate-sugar epimerase
MKKLLITGASGFIGEPTLKAAAAEKDLELHAVYHTHRPSDSSGIFWHRADLLDPKQVSALFAELKPGYLIQLAWCTGQGTYWKDHANFDWLAANLHIAREFSNSGGERCVFAGTSAEYDWSGNRPLNEVHTPLTPLLLYGGSKLALFWALTRFFEQQEISFSWVRFFNPFGEGEDRMRLIPKTCLRLLNGEELKFDAALSLRDFLHVEDAGNAVFQVLLSGVNGPVNIGSGEAISVREVISAIAEYYNCVDRVSFEKASVENSIPDSVVADTKKLVSECGWSSIKTFKERIAQTCEWWKTIHQKQTTET